jgi:hypothetical protein
MGRIIKAVHVSIENKINVGINSYAYHQINKVYQSVDRLLTQKIISNGKVCFYQKRFTLGQDHAKEETYSKVILKDFKAWIESSRSKG